MSERNPNWPSPLLGAIVAMDTRRVIGLDGQIPWHFSTDLKRFKQQTLNCTIVMGRLTWESIGKKALPQRRNIVISSRQQDNVETFSSVEAALKATETEDTWIIGGGQIYRACFDRLNYLDITHVPVTIEQQPAVTFPEIDQNLWQLCHEEVFDEENQLLNRQYKVK